MIVTTFLWGLSAVITKTAIGDTPESFRPFIFNGIRIPAGTLLLFAALKLSGKSAGIRKKHIPLIAAVSFFGMFVFSVLFVTGINLTSVSNTGIFNSTIPLFVLLLSFISKIERPVKRTVLGVCIGFLGMIAVTYNNGNLEINTGDLLIIASCFAWASYTVYAKKITGLYEPITAIAWVCLFASLYQIPLFLHQLPEQTWSTISALNWFNCALSATGPFAAANILYYYAIERIGPSRVSVYINLTPVFTLIFAVTLRDEIITPFQILGLVIVIAGIAVTRYGRNDSKEEKTL